MWQLGVHCTMHQYLTAASAPPAEQLLKQASSRLTAPHLPLACMPPSPAPCCHPRRPVTRSAWPSACTTWRTTTRWRSSWRCCRTTRRCCQSWASSEWPLARHDRITPRLINPCSDLSCDWHPRACLGTFLVPNHPKTVGLKGQPCLGCCVCASSTVPASCSSPLSPPPMQVPVCGAVRGGCSGLHSRRPAQAGGGLLRAAEPVGPGGGAGAAARLPPGGAAHGKVGRRRGGAAVCMPLLPGLLLDDCCSKPAAGVG